MARRDRIHRPLNTEAPGCSSTSVARKKEPTQRSALEVDEISLIRQLSGQLTRARMERFGRFDCFGRHLAAEAGHLSSLV